MKNIVCVCIATTLAAFLMSCNGGGAASTASGYLSRAEQKKRLQEVQAARDNAQLAIPASNPVAPDPALFHESALAALTGDLRPLAAAFSSASVGNATEARIEMQEKLYDALDGGRCKITKAGLEGATSAAVDVLGEIEGTLDVSGVGCPVSFSLSVTMTHASQGETQISYAAKYSVQDPAYRALNDVDSFEMSLQFGVVISRGSSSDLERITAVVDNRIHSQKYGNLIETGRGTGTSNSNSGGFGANFEMKVTDTFSDFSIERVAGFSADNSGKDQFHYAVNGSPVSKEEFESYGRLELPLRDN